MKIKETYFQEVNFTCQCPVCSDILTKFECNTNNKTEQRLLEPWEVSSFSTKCNTCNSIIKYSSVNGQPYITSEELIRESLKSISLLSSILDYTERNKKEIKQFLQGCKLVNLERWKDKYKVQIIRTTLP